MQKILQFIGALLALFSVAAPALAQPYDYRRHNGYGGHNRYSYSNYGGYNRYGGYGYQAPHNEAGYSPEQLREARGQAGKAKDACLIRNGMSDVGQSVIGGISQAISRGISGNRYAYYGGNYGRGNGVNCEALYWDTYNQVLQGMEISYCDRIMTAERYRSGVLKTAEKVHERCKQRKRENWGPGQNYENIPQNAYYDYSAATKAPPKK